MTRKEKRTRYETKQAYRNENFTEHYTESVTKQIPKLVTKFVNVTVNEPRTRIRTRPVPYTQTVPVPYDVDVPYTAYENRTEVVPRQVSTVVNETRNETVQMPVTKYRTEKFTCNYNVRVPYYSVFSKQSGQILDCPQSEAAGGIIVNPMPVPATFNPAPVIREVVQEDKTACNDLTVF